MRKKINFRFSWQVLSIISFVILGFVVSHLLKVEHVQSKENYASLRKIFVSTVNLDSTSYNIKLDVNGIVEPANIIDIVPEVSGRVVNVSKEFAIGNSFDEGDILFVLDKSILNIEKKKLEAQILSDKQKLMLEQAETKRLIAEWKKTKNTVKVPELISNNPQLLAAETKFRSTELMFEKVILDLDKADFKLPFNGKILSSNISFGQYVYSGKSYGSVYDISKLRVKVALDENQLSWIMKGDIDAKIQLDYFGKNISYDAYFSQNIAELKKDTHFADGYFYFRKPDENILPGMFVNIKIIGKKLDNVMMIPLSAIQSDGMIWRVVDRKLYKWMPDIIYMDQEHAIIESIGGKTEIVNHSIDGVGHGMEIDYRN